jgi:GTP pyrophosphokinase
MYEYMHEMQLLAFEQLEPEAYQTITGRLKQIRENGDKLIEEISQSIASSMERAGIKARVSGREKHPYSIWKKMQERHVAFEQLSDINAFRIVVEDTESCYRALGVLHRRWQMVPGRFKDFISTPKRNGYRSIHTTIMFAQNMRVEVQIRSQEMHRAAEYGLAAHWAYKQDDAPDGQAGWLRDLIEILETSQDPEELLENTRMAMYQDRIFAFTPKGALHQLPKGSTPVDFAYAVHTDLGDRAVGAKVNGRHVPLRTLLNNGDMVEILSSKAHQPEPAWLNFVATGKARAAIRRHVRHRERDELVQLGRQLFEDICSRLPGKIGAKAIKAALGRLQLDNEDELMFAIGSGKLSDRRVMVALVPGFDPGEDEKDWPSQERAISIRGLTPGVSFELGECCHPVPGDRIVGLRREGLPVHVHTIHCERLGADAEGDWLDLSWGQGSDGGSARMRVIIHNRPGMLAEMAGIFGFHKANIINLRMTARDASFHTFEVDLEVHDLPHLMRILSALRASDAVAQADRVFG